MLIVSEQEQDKPERLAFSISDTAWVLGNVSQNHIRDLLKEKALDKVQVGRRVMVTTASIKRFLAAGGSVR